MYNAQMHHLWLHQDEKVESITLSMNRFEDLHASTYDPDNDKALFKTFEGYYISFVECLKDLINIAVNKDLRYDFYEDNPMIDLIEKDSNHITQTESWREVRFMIDSYDHIIPYMRRVFGKEFYRSARRMRNNGEEYEEFIDRYEPSIIFSDIKGKKYKAVYDNLINMAQNAIHIIKTAHEGELNTIIYHGHEKCDNVYFEITNNGWSKYYPIFVKLYTNDPVWRKREK